MFAGPERSLPLGLWVTVFVICWKETSRLASQIRRLYGANRRAKKPFWLCLTEFVVGSLIYEECFRMNDGFSNYLVRVSDHSAFKARSTPQPQCWPRTGRGGLGWWECSSVTVVKDRYSCPLAGDKN